MKIVSLLPSTTEICFALGLGGSVFGVTHECDYPAAARSLPKLTRNVLPAGEYSSAEIDRMVAERVLNGCAIYDLDTALLAALEPDLILTQALCPVCAVSYDDVVGAAAALPRMPRVATFEPHTVADIIASIAEVARLAGVPEQGDRLCTQLTDRIAAVQRRVVALPAVRVLCLEWLDPPMVGGHWVPEMVRLAGGIDVLGVAGQPSVPVSWPEVEASDPDMIVLMPCGFDLPATVEVAAELDHQAAWQRLRAVRTGHVFAVDGSAYFNRPGPRVVDGIELLAELLHPAVLRGRAPRGSWGPLHSVTRHPVDRRERVSAPNSL